MKRRAPSGEIPEFQSLPIIALTAKAMKGIATSAWKQALPITSLSRSTSINYSLCYACGFRAARSRSRMRERLWSSKMAPKMEVSVNKAPPAAVIKNRVKILLVDDSPENLVSLEAALEILGEDLVLANSGTEALRHLLEGDFAAILLDVKMPDLDGFRNGRTDSRASAFATDADPVSHWLQER